MIDKRFILNHYQSYIDDDGVFIKTLDQLEQSIMYYENHVSDFLSPDLAYAFEAICKASGDISYDISGGINEAERTRIQFYPEFNEPIKQENLFTAVRILYNTKFNQLSHRDALGALMGLGISRQKVGDITIIEGGFEVILMPDIVDYVLMGLDKIGRAGVKANIISLGDVTAKVVEKESFSDIVKSLRLDSLVASAYKLSRAEAQRYIESERVKLNYKVTSSPASPVKEGDLVSLRGKGRVALETVDGTTKKDRIRITLSKYI